MDARKVVTSAVGRNTTCTAIGQSVTAPSNTQELRTLQHVDCEKHRLVQPCDLGRARVLDDGKAAAQLFDPAAAVCDMDVRKVDASADGRKTTRTALEQSVKHRDTLYAPDGRSTALSSPVAWLCFLTFRDLSALAASSQHHWLIATGLLLHAYGDTLGKFDGM